MASENLPVHAVILAGGRGTRFWPQSRTKTPKQLLNIIGKGTMLEQTVARFRPIVPAQRIWTVTNREQQAEVRKQLPKLPKENIVSEPMGRDTTAAVTLASSPVASSTFFASSTVAGRVERMMVRPGMLVKKGLPLAWVRSLEAADLVVNLQRARATMTYLQGVVERTRRLLVLRPVAVDAFNGDVRTGKMTRQTIGANGIPVYPVRRFAEKPSLEIAKQYLTSGDYQWNAGMFFWRVSTFLDELQKYLPKTFEALQTLAAHIGTRKYETRLRKVYPKLENISVDYAILEPATRAAPDP